MEQDEDECCGDHPDAARSVHLWYHLPNDVISVTNEVCVKNSCPGTYFCIVGFDGGYSGIQELYDGERKLIFSVWDNESDDDPVPERRVKVLYAGEGVEVSRFGNEGTGGKTMMPYEWKDNEPVKFRVTAETDDEKKWTSYSCFVYNFDNDTWFHIATLQTIANGKLLRGIYSFVEDFKRDGNSYYKLRKAHFGECCAVVDGKDVKCTRVQFTADNTQVNNINAGSCEGKFFLETGSNIVNSHAPLNGSICIENTQ